MNSPLTQEEAMALLPELALGMLPRDEAERLIAFIRAFPEAQQELASLRGAAGALDSSVPADPMVPARKLAMRDRLMSRAAASRCSSNRSSCATPTIIYWSNARS